MLSIEYYEGLLKGLLIGDLGISSPEFPNSLLVIENPKSLVAS